MILLDTHVVIWLLGNPERLSKGAARLIRKARAETGVAICSVTLFEIAQLTIRGRIGIAGLLSDFLGEIATRFVLRDINPRIAFQSAQFNDPYPRDPFDRLIGATAVVEGMALITADEMIRNSGQVQTVW